MYHIAICDDDSVFVSYITKIINLANQEQEEIKIYRYSSGEELVDSLEGYVLYDLLILDMQLGGIDGDETARQFRMKFPDTVLVFCSGVCPPSVESFKVTPYRYLLKSYSEHEFVCEMKEIISEVKRNTKEIFIIGHYRNKVIKVKFRNVLYIENSKRGSRVVVSPNCEEAKFGEQILIDEKIKELSEKYEGLLFAHNSYVVNINHVNFVDKEELTLDSGEMLSVSRNYYKEFREAFTKSIANKY